MTEKDMKKLSRVELLELLINQSKELQNVQARLEKAEKELEDRRIAIDNIGSIAEASLQLNGIFQAAQNSCDQYLENVRELSERQVRICEEKERECLEKTKIQMEETRRLCEKLESETRIQCEEMVEKARMESKAYWDEVHTSLESYCKQHRELKEILSLIENR